MKMFNDVKFLQVFETKFMINEKIFSFSKLNYKTFNLNLIRKRNVPLKRNLISGVRVRNLILNLH